MTAPHITTEYDCDTECFRLMATSHQRTEPAGPRLYRGGDFPVIQFAHEDKDAADRDCAALQEYVTLAWAGKAPKAKGREEAEEKKMTKWDFANAVWMI